jgi:hypothetical protein
MYRLVLGLAADGIAVAVTYRVFGFSKQVFYQSSEDHVLTGKESTKPGADPHVLTDSKTGTALLAPRRIEALTALSIPGAVSSDQR